MIGFLVSEPMFSLFCRLEIYVSGTYCGVMLVLIIDMSLDRYGWQVIGTITFSSNTSFAVKESGDPHISGGAVEHSSVGTDFQQL